MTICVAVHVPRKGAVFVGDGRATQEDHVVSDGLVKLQRCGSATLAVAGSCVAVLKATQRARSWAAARKALVSADIDDWEIVVYNALQDTLLSSDQDGFEMAVGPFYAIGGGAAYALGVLEALEAPSSLQEALRQAEAAVGVACKYSTTCGGQVTSLVHRRRR